MEDQFTSVQWDEETPWDTEFHKEHTLEQNQEESQLLGPGLIDDGEDVEEEEPVAPVEQAEPVEPVEPVESSQSEVTQQLPLVNETIQLTTSKPTFNLSIKIQNPKTIHEGSNVYTQYEVKIESDNPKLKNGVIFRRYSDFDFLFQCLSLDFPTLLVPPLPNKKRLEYIKGGRFTEEFIFKRLNSLNLFINRVINHPILSKSEILMIFLNDDDDIHWKTYKTNLNLNTNGGESSSVVSSNIDGVTDFIMNSFKKPTLESKYSSNFNDISVQTNKLEDNVNKIDKIYSKVVSKQNQISKDLHVFGEEFSKLSILFKNDVNGKHRPQEEIDPETLKIVSKFNSFSNNLKQTGENFTQLNHFIEFNYLNNLKDLEHYIGSFNQLIKLKDSKIIDYEVLNSYLDKSRNELINLQNGGPITNSTEGAISYWGKKLEYLTGITSNNNQDLIQQRISKLNDRIKLLEFECEKTKNVFQIYETDVLNEWTQFQKEKDSEILQSLKELTKMHQQFYKSCQESWDTFDNEDLQFSFKNKFDDQQQQQVNDDNDNIGKTQREINEGLQKLGIE